jgi:hypothetical protein
MKRSSSHRALTFGRVFSMGVVALALLAGGFHTSWATAQHVLLAKGREQGTLTVTGCGSERCAGSYRPDEGFPERSGLTIEKSVGTGRGAVLDVVVKPGTAHAVRSGTGGAFRAVQPLGGALLLAALVIGGGLRLTRTAWAAAAAGGVLLVGAFATL